MFLQGDEDGPAHVHLPVPPLLVLVEAYPPGLQVHSLDGDGDDVLASYPGRDRQLQQRLIVPTLGVDQELVNLGRGKSKLPRETEVPPRRPPDTFPLSARHGNAIAKSLGQNPAVTPPNVSPPLSQRP